jgi:hypothetical protein
MRRIAILVFCIFAASCAKVETAANENIQINSNKTVSPIVEKQILLKPVKPNIKLNAKQQKYLNKSLPPEIREILEKAERFEVLAEVKGQDNRDDEGMRFEPNRIVKITDENEKKEVLEALYVDAATDEPPATCYLPHHAIHANHQGKTVEVEICFNCSRFLVKSESGEFEGTLVRENLKSEDLLNRIIESKSIEIK